MTDEKPREDEPAEQPETVSESETQEPTEPEAKEERPRPRALGLLLVGLIAVVALVAAAGLGFTGYRELQRIDTLLSEQQKRVTSVGSEIAALDAHPSLQAVRQDIGSGLQAVTSQQEQQAQRIQALQDAISAVHAQTTRSQRGWIVAETEYLMRTASYRLHLARDIDGAIAALRAADQRLHELADPSLLNVRQALADELQALSQIERPNLIGADLRLDRMITGLKPLPLAGPLDESTEQTPSTDAEGEERSWEGLVKTVWSGLSEHITVRRHGTAVLGLPEAEVEMYLHQMLRLRLEATRLALLREDDAAFHRQIASAVAWMDEHFAQEEVAALRAELVELDTIDLRPELPDIGGSLRLLEQSAGARLDKEESTS